MSLHDKRFPGESSEYRNTRDALLEAEFALREQIEKVAALRRQLPPGGLLAEDYVFGELDAEETRDVRLSELFVGDRTSLLLYSFMYGPAMEQACPMCTSFIDGLNAMWPHLTQRVSLAVVGKSPIRRLEDFRAQRGWGNVRMLSSSGNSYNTDYHGQAPDGGQNPTMNVFVREGSEVRHFWSSEALFAKSDGQARHIDLLWPLWNFFDLTPEGRGTDWYPRLEY